MTTKYIANGDLLAPMANLIAISGDRHWSLFASLAVAQF
jgi:hypothetical protein